MDLDEALRIAKMAQYEIADHRDREVVRALRDAVKRVQKLAADNPPEWGRCCLAPAEILAALDGEVET